MFVKIGDFVKFKGFLSGIPREQAILRKSKAPRKSPEKWIFLSLAFYNAPSLHTVNETPIFIVFSAKMQKLKKHKQEKKNTICENNCANCSCQNVRFFSAFFIFAVFQFPFFQRCFL